MTENQERFKEQYIADIFEGTGEMDEELLKLFDVVLAEFDDDPEKMSAFIQSIIDEHTPPEPNELEQLKQENEKLKNRVEEMAKQQALTDGAIMDLASMVLTKL